MLYLFIACVFPSRLYVLYIYCLCVSFYMSYLFVACVFPLHVLSIYCLCVCFQLRDLVVGYSENFKDPLVRDPPPWYMSFTICECILQFPFFFVAVYALWKGRYNYLGYRTVYSKGVLKNKFKF